MNNEIQRFDFRGALLRTLTDEAGEPWFVAKDVCDILGHSNVSMALDRLDDDERSKFNLGRQGETNIVNEAGLYVLVLGSRKPEAHEFKRWVTHEVLPSIRKTGGYIPTSESDSDEDIMARAVLVAQKTIKQKNQQIAEQQTRIVELEPKRGSRTPWPRPTARAWSASSRRCSGRTGWTSARTDCSVFFRLTGISASPVRIATCRHSVRWTSACSASRRPPSPMRTGTPRSAALRRSRARGSAISSTGTGVALSRRWKLVRDERQSIRVPIGSAAVRGRVALRDSLETSDRGQGAS